MHVNDDPVSVLAAFEESRALVRSGASDQTYAHTLVRIAELRATYRDPAAFARSPAR